MQQTRFENRLATLIRYSRKVAAFTQDFFDKDLGNYYFNEGIVASADDF